MQEAEPEEVVKEKKQKYPEACLNLGSPLFGATLLVQTNVVYSLGILLQCLVEEVQEEAAPKKKKKKVGANLGVLMHAPCFSAMPFLYNHVLMLFCLFDSIMQDVDTTAEVDEDEVTPHVL